MDYYIGVLKKYAVFTGRARRAEYWWFVLISALVSLGLSIISMGAGDSMGILSIVYGLGVFIPNIAVGVRRLHDTKHSGWWLLISLIPLIGAIWLIVLMFTDGTPGDNEYGPNPKGVTAAPAPATTPTPTAQV
jgi:uncharacterized membrane protein YhaH (DUF805 family)